MKTEELFEELSGFPIEDWSGARGGILWMFVGPFFELDLSGAQGEKLRVEGPVVILDLADARFDEVLVTGHFGLVDISGSKIVNFDHTGAHIIHIDVSGAEINKN